MTDLERVELAMRRALHGKPTSPGGLLESFINELEEMNEYQRGFEPEALRDMRRGNYA